MSLSMLRGRWGRVMVDLKEYSVRGRDDIAAYKNIVLFGAGNYLPDSINSFGREKILAILDNDPGKWGEKIEGIQVDAPKVFFQHVTNDDYAIVMSTSRYQYEIADSLVRDYHISEGHMFSLCPDFQEEKMYDSQEILSHLDEINEVYEFLADEESKEYYINSLIARLTHDPLKLKPNKNMAGTCYYLGSKAIKPLSGGYVLDCGAYIGDTAQIFLDMMENKGKIYCFEPFGGNYERLCEWVRQMKMDAIVEAHQIAVSDEDGSMIISAGDEVSMQANLGQNEKKKNRVCVRGIDSMTFIENVDFIKMDIEGTELNAIRGAEKTIAFYKPQMMISAYHVTSHLWEIPLLLKKIVPEYEIYMGHQPNVSFEPEIYVSL